MSDDKQKKREKEAAKKITAALLGMGHEATVDASGSGATVVRIADVGMTFEVTESTRGRSGSWLLWERAVDVRETVYCPSTHKDLGEQGLREIKHLIRQANNRREVMRQNVERRKHFEAARAALGDLPSGKGRGAPIVTAKLDERWNGDVSGEVSFGVYVPTERAEDFARLVRGFFDSSSTA